MHFELAWITLGFLKCLDKMDKKYFLFLYYPYVICLEKIWQNGLKKYYWFYTICGNLPNRIVRFVRKSRVTLRALQRQCIGITMDRCLSHEKCIDHPRAKFGFMRVNTLWRSFKRLSATARWIATEFPEVR